MICVRKWGSGVRVRCQVRFDMCGLGFRVRLSVRFELLWVRLYGCVCCYVLGYV